MGAVQAPSEMRASVDEDDRRRVKVGLGNGETRIWRGQLRILLIITTLLLGVSGIACDMETTSDSSGIDQGLGSSDASGDASLGVCKVRFQIVTCALTIVNSSDGRSDYYIEASLEDSSGAKVGTANTLVSGVEGGQTAHDELTGTVSGKGKDVQARVTTVQRTSS